MPNPESVMNQTVAHERATGGYDNEGRPAHEAPEEIPARDIEKQQLVLGPHGQEVVSSSEIWTLRETKVGDLLRGQTVQGRANKVAKDGTVLFWKSYL